MSTILDLKTVQAGFTAHQAEHHCRPRLMAMADGQEPCDKRLYFWQLLNDTAFRLGIEPGDAAKVAGQYAYQTEQLGKRIPAGG